MRLSLKTTTERGKGLRRYAGLTSAVGSKAEEYEFARVPRVVTRCGDFQGSEMKSCGPKRATKAVSRPASSIWTFRPANQQGGNRPEKKKKKVPNIIPPYPSFWDRSIVFGTLK